MDELLNNPLVFWSLVAGGGVLVGWNYLAGARTAIVDGVGKLRSLIPLGGKSVPTDALDDDAIDFAAYSRLCKRAERASLDGAAGPLNDLLPILFGPKLPLGVKV